MPEQTKQSAGKQAMSRGKYRRQQVPGVPALVEGDEPVFICQWSSSKTTQDRLGDFLNGGCFRAFETAESLLNHIEHDHLSQALRILRGPDNRARHYLCGWIGCDKTPQHLKRHVNSHVGLRKFTCPFDGCGKSFAAAQKRDKHVATHKSERNQCAQCQSSYTTPDRLRQHVQEKHEGRGPKQFPCPVQGCQYADHDSSNLSKHKRDHGENAPVCRWIGCQYRDKVFASNTRDGRPKGMWNHMQQMHGATADAWASFEEDHRLQMRGEGGVTPAISSVNTSSLSRPLLEMDSSIWTETSPNRPNTYGMGLEQPFAGMLHHPTGTGGISY